MGKRLDKIYDVTSYQTIEIQILPNISRSKGNQIMKFGQLVEYNIRNIFLEKPYRKCGGKTSPKPFSKKWILNISLDQQFEVLYSLFLLHVQVEGYRNILKQRCRSIAFISYKACSKNKEVWN